MKKKQSFEIEIQGCVDVRKNQVSADAFTDLFIQWIEENNWYFGGGINEYKEDSDTTL